MADRNGEDLDFSSLADDTAEALGPIYKNEVEVYSNKLPEYRGLTEEDLKELYEATWKELFIDGRPAHEMLYRAEQLLDLYKPWYWHQTIDSTVDTDYNEHDASLLDAAKLELVEAYSVVEPLEGWRILQSMGAGTLAKVEALAKYSRLPGDMNDEEFVDLARQEALHLDSTNTVIDALKLVAKYGRDSESAYIAMERTDLAALGDYNDQRFNDSILAIAASGFRPALGYVKNRVLLQAKEKLNISTARTCAMVILIERAMHEDAPLEAKIENYCDDEYQWATQTQGDEIEKDWTRLVSVNSEAIFDLMKEIVSPPSITDTYNDVLVDFLVTIPNLRHEDTQSELIQRSLELEESYARDLSGRLSLDALIQDIKNDRRSAQTYLRSDEDRKTEHDDWLWKHPHVIGHNPEAYLEREKKDELKQLQKTLRRADTLVLIRAIKNQAIAITDH